MEQTGPTIQEVVKNIAVLVAQVSTISGLLSLGITQFIKKFTKKSWVIAIFAIVFGFTAGLLVMKIFGQNYSSPLSLLVAGIAALAPAGVYSLTGAITKKSEENSNQI